MEDILDVALYGGRVYPWRLLDFFMYLMLSIAQAIVEFVCAHGFGFVNKGDVTHMKNWI